MNGAGLFFLLLLLLVIIPGAAFIGYTRWTAHRRGLPTPPLSAYNPFKFLKKSSSNQYGHARSSSGPVTWVKDKFASFRDHRAGQGYAGQTRGTRGFGPLDPDAAWDDRVALEADGVDEYGGHRGGTYGYEEQELGMHGPASAGARDQGPYGMHTASNQAMPAYGEERGRTRSREDLSYHGAGSMGQNELDARYDAAVHGGSAGVPAASKPSGSLGGAGHERGLSPGTKQERRSIFREDV